MLGLIVVKQFYNIGLWHLYLKSINILSMYFKIIVIILIIIISSMLIISNFIISQIALQFKFS
jgi:hypothetical protein